MIDPVDMSKPMFGNGFATVVASAIRVMGDRLILVGLTSDENIHPVGRWCQTTLFGKTCEFFPVMTVEELNDKYIKNLSFTIRLIRHWAALLEKTSDAVVTQNYMVMWWLAWTNRFLHKVFYYPGLGNQMLIGRKPRLGKLLHRLYDRLNFHHVAKMDLVVAAASQSDIKEYQNRWQSMLRGKPIYQLTTAVDTEMFFPQTDVRVLKEKYLLQDEVTYFVCLGRLARVKGIDFLIDALQCFNEQYGRATLLLIGEGEERQTLEKYAAGKGLEDSIRFFGNRIPAEVSEIINCADLCVVGSNFEGFSCAMVEQIACGKPLVSTNVSGASEIIKDGVNGFIVENRDPQEFALYMCKALELQGAGEESRKIAVEHYSEHVIWDRFLALLETSIK